MSRPVSAMISLADLRLTPGISASLCAAGSTTAPGPQAGTGRRLRQREHHGEKDGLAYPQSLFLIYLICEALRTHCASASRKRAVALCLSILIHRLGLLPGY